jgi:hypothetical protein
VGWCQGERDGATAGSLLGWPLGQGEREWWEWDGAKMDLNWLPGQNKEKKPSSTSFFVLNFQNSFSNPF